MSIVGSLVGMMGQSQREREEAEKQRQEMMMKMMMQGFVPREPEAPGPAPAPPGGMGAPPTEPSPIGPGGTIGNRQPQPPPPGMAGLTSQPPPPGMAGLTPPPSGPPPGALSKLMSGIGSGLSGAAGALFDMPEKMTPGDFELADWHPMKEAEKERKFQADIKEAERVHDVALQNAGIKAAKEKAEKDHSNAVALLNTRLDHEKQEGRLNRQLKTDRLMLQYLEMGFNNLARKFELDIQFDAHINNVERHKKGKHVMFVTNLGGGKTGTAILNSITGAYEYQVRDSGGRIVDPENNDGKDLLNIYSQYWMGSDEADRVMAATQYLAPQINEHIKNVITSLPPDKAKELRAELLAFKVDKNEIFHDDTEDGQVVLRGPFYRPLPTYGADGKATHEFDANNKGKTPEGLDPAQFGRFIAILKSYVNNPEIIGPKKEESGSPSEFNTSSISSLDYDSYFTFGGQDDVDLTDPVGEIKVRGE